MVNEMIAEWSKVASLEAKTTISEQINLMKSVPHPIQICSTEPKPKNDNLSKRRFGGSMPNLLAYATNTSTQ